MKYCNSLTNYSRFKTREVNVGNVALGGENPIRIQSMTTTNTMDTEATIAEAIRMIEYGCELVRITAPSKKDAENLKNIKEGLVKKGYHNPLIADIHYTPNAAEIAAEIIAKVRINPGNYADKKKFENIDYTDATYNAEINRIRKKFAPLVKICKKHGTAMRIGTNHGSLSDRILSRYGDTPKGMVESAMEFLRIANEANFHDIILSMKASNPLVMVHAYRLLVEKMDNSNLKNYPLHLGVTEAGEGEDGRIKSAIGIGTLLDEGIGDTVRVSLTEPPEFEPPIAKILVDRYKTRKNHKKIKVPKNIVFSPFQYNKRESKRIQNIGGENVPIVISDLSKIEKLTNTNLNKLGILFDSNKKSFTKIDTSPDYLYLGSNKSSLIHFEYNVIYDYNTWKELDNRKSCYPLINIFDFDNIDNEYSDKINFLKLKTGDLKFLKQLKLPKNFVLIIESKNEHFMPDIRSFFMKIIDLDNPVIIYNNYENISYDNTIVYSSTDIGGLFLQGFGDGIFISSNQNQIDEIAKINFLCFKILQGSRVRVTSTDFISCPSCGRTLFDLQETTKNIRSRTDHLKGLKIGIMGCIVNGPGEMADADYGYVGSGKDKITLYRGKEVVKRSVHYKDGVDELIELIKEDGNWKEPK